MLELNMLGKRTNWLLNIDFESSAVGSKVIYDKALSRTLTRKVITAGGVDGVVDHPTYGKMYRFDAKAYFDHASTVALANTEYQLDIGFLADNQISYLFATGGYPAAGAKSGSAVTAGQYADRFVQFFQVNETTLTFQRYFTGEPWSSAFVNLTITRKASGTTLLNRTTGATQTAASFNTGKDTYFRIGADLNNATVQYPFSGYIKFLRIKKL